MGDEKYKNRYYHKDKYEEKPMEVFGCAFVFLFVGILSLTFNAVNVSFIGLHAWGYWLFIPAFFMLIGGVNQITINKKYKKAVKSAIVNRGNQGIHKLEYIALEVGIRPKDLLKVLQDLRSSGEIQYRFNADGGEIELGKMVPYNPSSEFIAPEKVKGPIASEGRNYCVYCGQKFEKDAHFCPSCGSKISD